jgi:sulfatase maturation enzyme AslB (radical SAM superfamily)
MASPMRAVKQVAKGVPYLNQELRRRISMSTGRVFATPTTYYVIPTGRCNIACPYCWIHHHVDPTLSREVMFRIIREAKELSRSGFRIQLSGGEPMIYKPFYDALALAQELRVDFGFTTNGHALNKSNVAKILAFDPFNVNVSLDAIDATINEALRPMKDGTRRTLEGIENLVAEKERARSRVSIVIKPTIMDQNYKDLPNLVRYFGKCSKIQIHFQPFVGDTKDDAYYVKDIPAFQYVVEELIQLRHEGHPIVGQEETFRGFINYFRDPPTSAGIRHLDLGGQKRNCDIGLRSMFIYPNGDVMFCDFLKQAIGNIHDQSLQEIYYGVVAGEQRNKMIYCDIDCQQTCKRPTPLFEKARTFMRMG